DSGISPEGESPGRREWVDPETGEVVDGGPGATPNASARPEVDPEGRARDLTAFIGALRAQARASGWRARMAEEYEVARDELTAIEAGMLGDGSGVEGSAEVAGDTSREDPLAPRGLPAPDTDGSVEDVEDAAATPASAQS